MGSAVIHIARGLPYYGSIKFASILNRETLTTRRKKRGSKYKSLSWDTNPVACWENEERLTDWWYDEPTSTAFCNVKRGTSASLSCECYEFPCFRFSIELLFRHFRRVPFILTF